MFNFQKDYMSDQHLTLLSVGMIQSHIFHDLESWGCMYHLEHSDRLEVQIQWNPTEEIQWEKSQQSLLQTQETSSRRK